MKTVLHVIDTTGPGGAETVFIQLADRVRARGYRSVVTIRGPGFVEQELRRRGIEPIEIDAKGGVNWRFLRALVSLIRRERVDVIQSHLLGSNVYCALAGLLTRTPVIATFHGMVDVNPNERLRWLKLQMMNAGVSRFVAVSNGLRDAIQREGLLNPRKTEVIYNGVDLSRYAKAERHDLRHRLGLADDAILIGSLGNVRPAKGYDVLIKAASGVIERFPNAHFLIAGDIKQSVMAQLTPLLADARVAKHIHFLGYCNDSADFLAQLDVFLLSSTSEGFSISTIEALATGLPVVATRCGGPEEILQNEVTGLLVEAGLPQAITHGLLQILESEALAQRLAAAGIEHVRDQFGIEAMLSRYCALYEDN